MFLLSAGYQNKTEKGSQNCQTAFGLLCKNKVLLRPVNPDSKFFFSPLVGWLVGLLPAQFTRVRFLRSSCKKVISCEFLCLGKRGWPVFDQTGKWISQRCTRKLAWTPWNFLFLFPCLCFFFCSTVVGLWHSRGQPRKKKVGMSQNCPTACGLIYCANKVLIRFRTSRPRFKQNISLVFCKQKA